MFSCIFGCPENRPFFGVKTGLVLQERHKIWEFWKLPGCKFVHKFCRQSAFFGQTFSVHAQLNFGPTFSVHLVKWCGPPKSVRKKVGFRTIKMIFCRTFGVHFYPIFTSTIMLLPHAFTRAHTFAEICAIFVTLLRKMRCKCFSRT